MTPDEAPPATVKLRGDVLAKSVKQAVAEAAAELSAAGVPPKMAVILASEDPASMTYAETKKKGAAALGIEVEIHNLGSGATQAQLLESLPGAFRGCRRCTASCSSCRWPRR